MNGGAMAARHWYVASLVFPLTAAVVAAVALGWGASSDHPFVLWCARYWWLLLGSCVGTWLIACAAILVVSELVRAHARRARSRAP